jgi:predicted enzyme related to lactoylglutathione lyase
MPVHDLSPVGAPCWVDLFTSNTDGARAFYAELFGWAAEDPNPDFGGYFNFTKDGRRVAGCMGNDGQSGTPDAWSVYLRADDAEATVAASAAHGGGTIVPAMAVADLGTMAVVTDPSQAATGLWQPGTHRGFGVLAEPGAPSWFELQTRDYQAALAYYSAVFGWDVHVMSDAPDFRYSTNGQEDTAVAGVLDASATLPEGVPSHWLIYFGIADTDAALTSIESLGGTVVVPAADTPFGRIATVTDPTGALFKIVQAPSS